MLEQLRQLKNAEAWADLIQFAPALPADLTGDDLAKAYLWVSTAYASTATNGQEYRSAMGYARQAVAAAQPGGTMHAWALARVAAYSADMGIYPQAEAAALEFLRLVEHNPGAASMRPYALAALGRAQASRRQYNLAAATFRAALPGSGEVYERIQLHLAWTLAQAGRVSEAFDAIPTSVRYVPREYVNAAMAVVLAAAGDWVGAQLCAQVSLRAHMEKRCPIFDTIQAAELALIIHRAAVALGHRQAGFCLNSAALLSGWNAGLVDNLLPTIRAEGGASYNAAASHRGPAGHHRCGLRGCVG